MSRTPKPASTRFQTIRIEPSTRDYLRREAARLEKPWGYVLRENLEFVRTAGLIPSLLRTFEHELKRMGATVRELKVVVVEAVMRLPPVFWTLAPAAAREKYHVCSVNLSGADHEYLLMRMAQTKEDFTPVLNAELRVARTFGLRDELLARTTVYLASQRVERAKVGRDADDRERVPDVEGRGPRWIRNTPSKDCGAGSNDEAPGGRLEPGY